MKKIIICAEGTWQSPESDCVTHILRIACGIAPEDAVGNKQVVFYDRGVESGGDQLYPPAPPSSRCWHGWRVIGRE
jgi:uncharacterized protein (DUF2235 family)